MGMTIHLTPHLEELVLQKVSSGLYRSASEVMQEALRIMEEQDRVREAKLAQLRADIQAGLDSGPAEVWDPEQIKSAGHARRAATAPVVKG
jgi:antitoxin ParD1/3/4